MTLLSSCKHLDDIVYAEQLLKSFVKYFIKLYGSENVSHNIHNLLHISDDVKHFGSLDTFCAFPFENYMQFLKKIAIKGEKLLEQIVKTIYEQDKINNIDSEAVSFPKLCEEHFEGSTLNVIPNKKSVQKTIPP